MLWGNSPICSRLPYRYAIGCPFFPAYFIISSPSRAQMFSHPTIISDPALIATQSLWKVEIYAYCLMDNHYHLLLSTPTAGLSRAMRHLDGIYTQKFNRVHNRDGPLFRGRYKAILIAAEEYFLSVVRYIHKNPLAAGVVPDIDRYRWSSHGEYLNKKQCPNWLNTGSVMSRFSGLKE